MWRGEPLPIRLPLPLLSLNRKGYKMEKQIIKNVKKKGEYFGKRVLFSSDYRKKNFPQYASLPLSLIYKRKRRRQKGYKPKK
jgi:hypothetical protein